MDTAGVKDAIWTKGFIKILVCFVAQRSCTQMLNTILPVYVVSIGYSTMVAGLTVTLYSLSALLFRPFAGLVADKTGRYPVLIVGTVVLCVAVGLNALVLPVAVLLLVRCLQGAGFSWVGIGSGLWGLIAKLSGLSFVFVLNSGVVLLTLALYIAMIKRKLL